LRPATAVSAAPAGPATLNALDGLLAASVFVDAATAAATAPIPSAAAGAPTGLAAAPTDRERKPRRSFNFHGNGKWIEQLFTERAVGEHGGISFGFADNGLGGLDRRKLAGPTLLRAGCWVPRSLPVVTRSQARAGGV
jgi:hypothetical protein